MKLISVALTILSPFIFNKLYSTDYYWVSAVSSNWNNAANWSLTNGGAGGAGIPGTSDFAYFNGNGTGDCSIDANLTIDGFNVNGYGSTIDISGFTVLVNGSVNSTFADGTITDGVGTGSFSTNISAITYFNGTLFDLPVNCISNRIFLNGSTFNYTSSFEKNGSSNDGSNGGNHFLQDVTFIISSDGDIRLGTVNPDTCLSDVYLTHSGTDQDLNFGNNSSGNYIANDLFIATSGTGTASRVTVANAATSSVTIGGDVTVTQNGSATSISTTLGASGSLTINGNLDVTNNCSGTTANFLLSNNTGSTATINGTTTLTNGGTATTERFYLGNYGSVTFNNVVTVNNNSPATNSDIFFNYRTGSTNQFNENIIVNATDANSDGVSFGENGGSATLAASKTLTIGGGGFIAGVLHLENFTQTGNTAQNLPLTGTGYLYIENSLFGGDVVFSSPRINVRTSTFSRTSSFEKTGSTDDTSPGGNTFTLDASLLNSGIDDLTFGNGTADNFQANLTINNTSTGNITVAYDGAGHNVNGDIDITNSSTGTNGHVYLSSRNGATLNVGGSITAINSSAATSGQIVIANNGTIQINGDLDITNSSSGTNSYVYLANGGTSNATINGACNVINGGTATNNERVYLGQNGDVTFNGILSILNQSGAATSRVYLNTNSTGTYNENIIVEQTNANAQGIYFGNGTGSGVLAATKTITIGASGYVAGYLYFNNFTQTGNTAHSLTLTGTGRIYSGNSTWGGDVIFTAPRIETTNTLYSRTAVLNKTGATSDYSAGGNTFSMDVTFINSGSGGFFIGNGTFDSFNDNVILNNTGTSNLVFASSGPGHFVTNDLTVTNSASGTNSHIYLSNASDATLSVGGDLIVNNIGSATNNYVYVANSGTLDLTGAMTLTNASVGDTSIIYLANNTSSSVSITGTADIVNSNTSITSAYIYAGNNGDVTFNNDLTITNNSGVANSIIYLNHGTNSTNIYNGDIQVSVTDANSDGIYFGNSDGNGTLAATKTITVGGSGYIGGNLYFRNFTQVGNTAQSLTLTGTGRFTSRDSDWGGDITFISPRIWTQGTLYNRTAYIEKTGASDDNSAGGNTFTMDVTFQNSGSGSFTLGNGTFDTYSSNVTLNNVGTRHIYFANTGAGHVVTGNLTATNSTTGTGGNIYIGNNISSTLSIGGDLSIVNNATGTTSNIYAPNNATLTLSGNLDIQNTPAGNAGLVYIGNGPNSTTTINGNTTVLNSGSATTTERVYLGNNGDVTFNGTLDIVNNSSATNSQVYCNHSGNSSNTYNENITVSVSNASNDGIYLGNGGGAGALANTKTVTIGTGFIAGTLQFRNFNQIGGTPQAITLTGTATFNNHDSNWDADVDFIAPRHYTRGTTYNGVTNLEKNGINNDASAGGNTFNGVTTITNSGSGYFMPANGTGNDFNADVYYVKSSSGLVYPTYNCSSTYAADIYLESASTVRFGAATNGRVIFDGSAAQSINVVGATPTPEIRDIETQNAISEITLNTPVIVLVELDLQQGNLITTSTNLIYMNDNSIVSNVSDNSYVDGPLEKIGNDAFIFPVGKSSVYRPIEISAPASTSARFRGEFFANDVVNDGYPDAPFDATIDHISDCEYWILDRISSTNSVSVTLSYKNYGANNCSGVGDQVDLLVARWDGSTWKDHGNGGFTGTVNDGTVTSAAAITSFSPFTLATTTNKNPLPIELLTFNAIQNNKVVDLSWETASEKDNDYFVVERSVDGMNWEKIVTTNGAGTSSNTISYFETDFSPVAGLSYYRLKQVDYNGDFTYSNIVPVEFKNENQSVEIFPNPNDGKYFNINLEKFQNSEVLLVLKDITGKEIFTKVIFTDTDQTFTINFEKELPKGTYIVIASSEDDFVSKKMVVE